MCISMKHELYRITLLGVHPSLSCGVQNEQLCKSSLVFFTHCKGMQREGVPPPPRANKKDLVQPNECLNA